MDGLLIEVVTSTQGSAATAAVAVDETVVPVENLTDFASDGGRVDIAGTVYDYTGLDATDVDADGVGGSLLLDTPLTVAVAEFDPVLLLAGDVPATDYYAVVDLVDDEVGEPVWVPLASREERLAWPVRAYDPPLPVTLSGDLSRIVTAPGVVPQMDGALIDPATIPSPPPLQTFSADPPSDTTGFDEDHAWWQVDADGQVLGFWRLISGVWTAQTITTIEALKANNVLTTALTGEQITGATVQTRAEPDRGIKLLATVDEDGNPVDAFYVFDEAGIPFLSAVPSPGDGGDRGRGQVDHPHQHRRRVAGWYDGDHPGRGRHPGRDPADGLRDGTEVCADRDHRLRHGAVRRRRAVGRPARVDHRRDGLVHDAGRHRRAVGPRYRDAPSS